MVAAVPWEEHLSPRHTFSIHATVRSSELTHSHFVALRTKDAIVDRMRDRTGETAERRYREAGRPYHCAPGAGSGGRSPSISAEPLHRRGWRIEAEEAPLRETLAAAMLALGHYDPTKPFSIRCAVRTLAIEAALIARNIAPGRGRHFGFMRWPTFGDAEAKTFRDLQEAAKAVALPKAPAPILARDRFEDPLETTHRNAERAGVRVLIEALQQDARNLIPMPPECQIFVNPPYGERLGGKRLQLEGLYRGFGEGVRALRGRAAADGALRIAALRAGLWPSRARHPLFNGPIEMHLLRYGPELQSLYPNLKS